ncbi:MAG: hypothetical protein ACKV2U_00115 [Bryobacteraceae bacterium]
MTFRLISPAPAVSVQAQRIITTFAGTEWAFPATAHPALTSPLSSILNTAVDNRGRLVVADGLNHIVARVNSNGELTVIAGNGLRGFSGDGGDALQAALNQPEGIAFDSAGNLYIVDFFNNRIRRVTPAGVITTVAGNGSAKHGGDGSPAISAGLDPWRIAIDRSNAILIADYNNRRVRRVGADGIISTIAGTGQGEFSGEGKRARETTLTPTAIHVDREGRILIADTVNYRVYRIGADGILSTLAGTGKPGFSGDGGPAIAATMQGITALTTDAAGNILLADTINSRIRRITPAGIISTIAGGGTSLIATTPAAPLRSTIGLPESVAVDPLGRVYIADVKSQSILLLSADGTVISRVAGNGKFKAVTAGTPAPLVNMSEPSGVAIGPDGSVYYVELAGGRVAKIDPNGGVTVIAGNGMACRCAGNGSGANGLLAGANSLAVAPDGALIVVDGVNQEIRRIFQGGNTSIAGTTGTAGFSGDGVPATQALLHNPWGVTIDPAGNIIFIDQGTHRVRRIDTRGIITTVAGNGWAGFSGDGGPATAASLDRPFAVALAASGDLLIADTLNSRIRAVSPAGIIRTWAGNGTSTYDGDGGPATRAGIDGPYALAVDSGGSVYISHNGSVIRRISPDGIISTVAGLDHEGFSGDDGSPTNAALNFPFGLAVDSAGNLFAADFGNNRIRVIRNRSLAITLSPSLVRRKATAGSGAA